jgi:TfoX/Sxy family transcriptional regulator of competence genes
MACDEQLVERIRGVLKGVRGAAERRMFGGVCFTVNGHMVCGVVKDQLMVRVGPEQYADALEKPHVRPMDFTGRPMKGYVFVMPPATRSASLKAWVRAGVTHAQTLLPKSPKRKSATRSEK